MDGQKMLLINNQQIICCDEWIDTHKFCSLEPNIIKGICLAEHVQTTYGPNILGRRPNYYKLNQQILAEKGSLHHDIYTSLPTKTAKILFTKLWCGVYSGGTSVTLRTTDNYADKNSAEKTKNTNNFKHFGDLTNFIYNDLPFKEVGRILLFLNDHDLSTPIHTDGIITKSHRNEFLWMRTNIRKPFFVYDDIKLISYYAQGYTSFFNEQCYHGTDPAQEMNFSIRVDGVFTDKFREQLDISHIENYNE